MQTINLSEKYESLYFLCLEDWSDEIKEAGDHKSCWYNKMKDKGLRVKLSLNNNGDPVGMIQYLPIELSRATGRDLYFIQCIWVHGYKQGRGNFQKRGHGKALLNAAEDDARQLGAKGMAAWGVGLPFWMKASWFKKQGYQQVDKDGIGRLVWKAFSPDAAEPRFIKQQRIPESIPGQVTVTAFLNGCCSAQNMVYERARRAAAGLGNRVVFNTIDTSERDTFLHWGLLDALFIDGKQINTGPPPSLAALKRRMAKNLKKLK